MNRVTDGGEDDLQLNCAHHKVSLFGTLVWPRSLLLKCGQILRSCHDARWPRYAIEQRYGRFNFARNTIKSCLKLTNRLSMSTWSLFCRVCKSQGERRSLRKARKRWTMTPILDGHKPVKLMKMWFVCETEVTIECAFGNRIWKQSGNHCSVALLKTNKTICAPSRSSNCCWRTSKKRTEGTRGNRTWLYRWRFYRCIRIIGLQKGSLQNRRRERTNVKKNIRRVFQLQRCDPKRGSKTDRQHCLMRKCSGNIKEKGHPRAKRHRY